MYSLLMSADPTTWDNGSATMGRDRFLEHTDSAVAARFRPLDDDLLSELKKYPVLFSYEKPCDRAARLGWVTDIQRLQNELQIKFYFDNRFDPMEPELMERLQSDLDITKSEIYREHWALKEVDLIEVMTNAALLISARQPQTNRGRTLTTKFVEVASEATFAVVLITPDDVGGLSKDGLRPRARQNVIFELGYFIGLLGPDKVCALVSGEVERPSDFEAVVYVAYGPTTGWRAELARELRDAGIRFDANKVF
jgi:Predicted nucleotide-binding protein containing TIR-like domain